MATYSGRNARVSVNSGSPEAEHIIAELSNWDIDLSTDEVDTTSFGSGWAKSDVGMKKWSGTLTGFCDPTDTTGQKVLEDSFLNGTLIDSIRFYVKHSTTSGESIVYYAPDTATDATAGARVTSLKVSQDKSGVASLSVSFSGSGPLKRFTSTVTP